MYYEEPRIPALPGEENVTDGSVDDYGTDWENVDNGALEEEMAKTGEEYSKEKVIALTEENNEIGFPVPLDLSIFVYTFQYPLDKETAVSYESMYEKLKQEPMFEGAIDVAEGGE